MILNGNQRGGAKNLALHLLKEENERVEVRQLRGFASDNLQGALQESYAVSRATRCRQHMFSLSLNPPKGAIVSHEDFEDAVDRVEKRLGLTSQPRAIVIHDKRGEDGELRRHAHAVWCRIDTDEMKAVQLSFTHNKLREVSRELFISHDWRIPDGLMCSEDRNPRNYTLAEWQQAKRAKKDPAALKEMFQDCWAASDGKAALRAALLERGYILAQGRRGHVAVDHQGEAYPISRWTGRKAREVRERLGPVDDLPDVTQAQAQAAKIIADRLRELRAQEAQALKSRRRIETEKKKRLLAQQAREAGRLREEQAKRQAQERAERAARLRKGLLGVLDRITGKRKQTIKENEKEAASKRTRDTLEKQDLEHRQSAAQSRQSAEAKAAGASHREAVKELTTDIQRLSEPPEPSKDDQRKAYVREQKARSRRPRRARSRDRPGLER